MIKGPVTEDIYIRWAVKYVEIEGEEPFKLKRDPVLQVRNPWSGAWSDIQTVEIEIDDMGEEK